MYITRCKELQYVYKMGEFTSSVQKKGNNTFNKYKKY